MKKHSFSERFRYRFDNLMARGNVSMIKMLLLATLVVVIGIAVAIHFLTPAEERDFVGSFWDALASAVNAWMPYSDDGGLAYILLTALAAGTGLLFTSILIGIIASAIEEKVTGLKDGNSVVLEHGHVVVLGFTSGEYTLLRQLIAAARGEKQCIVVAGAQPRSEIESDIRGNVEIPKNVRIICRSAEAGDIAAMQVCSIPDCRTVVINQPDDAATVKSTLAAYRILTEAGRTDVRVISNVSDEAFLLPRDVADAMGLICVSVNDVVARVVARSCTEAGISGAYADLFDVEGGSIRLLRLPEADGKTFGEVLRTMDGAAPLGTFSDGRIRLNPPQDERIGAGDRLICWTSENGAVSFAADAFAQTAAGLCVPSAPAEAAHTVVIGNSPVLRTLLRELPERPNRVTALRIPPENRGALLELAGQRPDVSLSFYDGATDEAALRTLFADVSHVVILADDNDSDGGDDVMNMIQYIRINDLKKRAGLAFNVTLELRSEKNLQLVGLDDENDLIVAPHLVSMFLAQLADSPGIAGVFKELLSNVGSEIHLKPASVLGGAAGTCAAARAALAAQGVILLGYIAGGRTVLNPPLGDDLGAAQPEKLIVVCEN